MKKMLLNKRLKLLASRKMTTVISGTGKGGIRS